MAFKGSKNFDFWGATFGEKLCKRLILVLAGLWKALRNGLQKILGYLGGLLGGLMFHIPSKHVSKRNLSKMYSSQKHFWITFGTQLGSSKLILDLKMKTDNY